MLSASQPGKGVKVGSRMPDLCKGGAQPKDFFFVFVRQNSQKVLRSIEIRSRTQMCLGQSKLDNGPLKILLLSCASAIIAPEQQSRLSAHFYCASCVLFWARQTLTYTQTLRDTWDSPGKRQLSRTRYLSGDANFLQRTSFVCLGTISRHLQNYRTP